MNYYLQDSVEIWKARCQEIERGANRLAELRKKDIERFERDLKKKETEIEMLEEKIESYRTVLKDFLGEVEEVFEDD